MALQNVVKNDRHTAQSITWYVGANSTTPKNLTGATITGTITNAAGTTRAITGTLTITNAASGVFSWAYSAADTATVGAFQVQFTATYASDGYADSSYSASWNVVVKY